MAGPRTRPALAAFRISPVAAAAATGGTGVAGTGFAATSGAGVVDGAEAPPFGMIPPEQAESKRVDRASAKTGLFMPRGESDRVGFVKLPVAVARFHVTEESPDIMCFNSIGQ